MKERLIEDWLTKINERGFELPYCQILVSEGYRILRVGHSPYEDGKDIIAINKKKGICAFQLKGGDLDLKTFEKHYPQIQALVESAVDLPGVKTNKAHTPYFVTTGTISDPVLNRVKNLNADWKRRKLPPLTLVGREQLLQDFLKISENFWPVEFPDVRAFLGLYLATGEGDLDRPTFTDQLVKLLSSSSEKPLPKSVLARRMAASNIYTSYILGEFYRKEDHWSIFCAWMICSSHIAWAADRDQLPPEMWKSSFDMAFEEAQKTLGKLSAETLSNRALFPREPELDDYTRARNTVALSAVAAWHLMQKLKGVGADTVPNAVDLVTRFVVLNRLCVWGESAVPHYLAVFWFFENFTGTGASDLLPMLLLSAICRRNWQGSPAPLEEPYKSFDDVVGDILEKFTAGRVLPGRPVACRSYTLECLVLISVRRMRRLFLSGIWSEVTKVEMAEFKPKNVRDLLLWECNDGEERHSMPDRPASWAALKQKAAAVDVQALPQVVRDNPAFALLFLLAYPHRVGTNLVQFLDKTLT